MGRRKLEMKRIEDKSSRQVTFSKRRGGLIKKARQLSVLCDIDVAVVIFSSRGKLYEFCSGGNSLGQILQRHQKSCLESEGTVATGSNEAAEYHSLCTSFRTSAELLQTMKRYVEEPNVEQLSVTDLMQLEEELDAALMQTRSRKPPRAYFHNVTPLIQFWIMQTQLMMEYITTLHEKNRMLKGENEEMEKEMASMEDNPKSDEVVFGVNGLETNRINHSPQQVTLPLFMM